MKNKILLALQIVVAIILVQTLYFKFTGAAESKFIFMTLGIEPWGRWASGVSELMASVLLFIPGLQIIGAAMGLGIMSVAILSHIFVLGIVVQNDDGTLFTLALVVFFACSTILFLRRNEFKIFFNDFKNKLFTKI